MVHTRETDWFIYGWIWLVLLSCACGCGEPPQAGTRGIGVYPGRPAESGAPLPVPGGKAHRNLAFRRAAKQSSAFDFDRTAQLVADGIRPGSDTSGFLSAWKSRGSEGEWLSVDLGARAKVDAMVFDWKNAPVSGTVLCSDDEILWKEICAIPEGKDFDRVEFRPVKGRYFKVQLDRTADGKPFELGEWEIYGRGGVAWEPKKAPVRADGRQDLTGGAWRLQRASEVTAAGEAVSREGFDAGGWIPATVPGTVLASYVNTGAVPDPNFADNHLSISESYFHSDFWYRDTFDACIDTERQFLHFDGVNWKAEVFLNGERLGRIESAFREEAFDVTGILRDGRNDLAVKVICNDHFGEVTVQDAFNSGKNGGLLGADNPTMHATVGWDWLPTVRGRSMGIYDDVYLTYTGPVTVEDPFVRTELPLPDTSYAHVYAQARLVNHADRPVSGTLTLDFDGRPVPLAVDLAAGEDRLVSLDPFRLDRPELWWPNGYGDPHLYDVSLAFDADGKVSDTQHFKVGVRQMTVSYDTAAPSRDGCIDRLNLFVNGKRVVGFGGNWGFPEHLMNYRAREYDAAVKYHADMHFTMIRNWVGQTGDREFYEACDRYGILVWQDFWLANPYDGPNPYYEDIFEDAARHTVRRIRNHPSIALYVGRNEGNPPESLDTFLSGMVAEEHPGIHYIPHSSEGPVSGGGPYRALPVQEYYTLFGAEKFHSERGMPAPMNYENILRAFGTEHVEPYSTLAHPNAMWGMHDYTLGNVPGASSAQRADTFNQMLEKAFGEPADAREFSRWAQWIAYDGYRAIFEGRSPARQGLLLWMSHPAWPSFVWQTYDYYLEPTASYFGCKKACEPVHVLLNPLTETVEAVNWYGSPAETYLAGAEIFGLDGKRLWTREESIGLGPDETVSCFPLAYPEDRPEVCFVRLRLTDERGALVSENLYWRGKEEGNLQALKSVAPATLSGEVLSSAAGGEVRLTLRLANTGDTPAMMLRVKVTDTATGDLVVPVLYSDNYFFLMPGESREVAVRLQKEDVAGLPKVSVSGFNVDEREFSKK